VLGPCEVQNKTKRGTPQAQKKKQYATPHQVLREAGINVLNFSFFNYQVVLVVVPLF
jgi:hypothetical protein